MVSWRRTGVLPASVSTSSNCKHRPANAITTPWWDSAWQQKYNQELGRILINRQPNADLDVPPNVRYWG